MCAQILVRSVHTILVNRKKDVIMVLQQANDGFFLWRARYYTIEREKIQMLGVVKDLKV